MKEDVILMISKDLGELTNEEADAITILNSLFNVILKDNKDIDEVLNCEFCGVDKWKEINVQNAKVKNIVIWLKWIGVIHYL